MTDDNEEIISQEERETRRQDLVREVMMNIREGAYAGGRVSLYQFKDEDIPAFIEALRENPQIKGFGSYGSLFTEKGAKLLADYIAEGAELTDLDFHCAKLGDEGAKAVMKAVEANPHVRKITVQNSGMTGESAEAIASMLRNNHTLESLELNDNRFGDEACKTIFEALADNKGLQRLRAFSCDMGEEGGVALAESLMDHPAMQMVELGQNSIGDSGAEAFGKVIMHNRTLTDISIHNNNNITEKGCRALVEPLRFNHDLVKLMVSVHGYPDYFRAQMGEYICNYTGPNLVQISPFTEEVEQLRIRNVRQTSEVAKQLDAGFEGMGPATWAEIYKRRNAIRFEGTRKELFAQFMHEVDQLPAVKIDDALTVDDLLMVADGEDYAPIDNPKIRQQMPDILRQLAQNRGGFRAFDLLDKGTPGVLLQAAADSQSLAELFDKQLWPDASAGEVKAVYEALEPEQQKALPQWPRIFADFSRGGAQGAAPAR